MSTPLIYTLSSSQDIALVRAGENFGPDGWLVTFVGVGWTGSIVLAQNTAPPGFTNSYSNVTYYSGNTYLPVTAGTAITVATVPYFVRDTGYNLWARYTHTAGTVTLIVTPANNASQGGTGPQPGPVNAGDVTSGTFGAYSGDTGTYAFPGAATVATTLTTLTATITGAATVGTTLGVTGTSTLAAITGTGVLSITVAQAASVGTSPGTAGTAFGITTGQGGATSIATTGTGGKGANYATTTGAGGTAALAATAGTGGAGGDYAVTTGAGAASAVTGTGTGTGGKGGALAFTSGVGGAVSVSTGVNIGGASGAIAFATAAGGASLNGSANTGGASGVITLATGDGGAGATAQGNSGAITLQTGASTATVGGVVLKPGGLTVLTASWVSATVGLVTIDGTYGAGVASLRLNGLTTAATANQTGTLTNGPVAGNPAFWMPISLAGTIRYVPCW